MNAPACPRVVASRREISRTQNITSVTGEGQSSLNWEACKQLHLLLHLYRVDESRYVFTSVGSLATLPYVDKLYLTAVGVYFAISIVA